LVLLFGAYRLACALQALSNQKLAEMRLRFGVNRVGLQTGDGSLNIGEAVLARQAVLARHAVLAWMLAPSGKAQRQLPSAVHNPIWS
jgi:hypothetical protein